MDAPSDYKTAGIFMTIAGVMNLITSGLMVLMLIWMCVGVFWFIPMVVAFGEIACGIMMLTGKRIPNVMIVSVLGLIAGLCNFNWIAILMEVLCLVWLNKPEVKEYLA